MVEKTPPEKGLATTYFVPKLFMLYDIEIAFSYILNTLHREAAYLKAIQKSSLNGFCFGTKFHLLQMEIKNFYTNE
jgi:hypothetical protein